MLSIIVAISENNGIGKGNKLLCHLPNDLKHFKKITTWGNVVMGRKTFQSIGKPLPNRANIVVTRDPTINFKNCLMSHQLSSVLSLSKLFKTDLFIIGGAEIYRQALELNLVDRLIVTHIKAELDADTFFPAIGKEWVETSREDHKSDERHLYDYSFVTYKKA